MTVGCCGSPRVSLQGLVDQADAYPASSPAGRRARARLAYTIVAAKAVQAGNRPGYERAMAGLRGLGDEGAGLVTARAARVRAAVASASSGPSMADVGAAIPAVVTLLAGIVRLATGLASRAGGDPSAIAAANTIASWIQAIVSGGPLTLPTLDQNTLDGFATFCRVGGDVKLAIDGLFVAAISGLGIAAATGTSGAAAAAVTVGTVQARLDGLFDSLCAAVAVQADPAVELARRNAECATGTPFSIWDAAANQCNCMPGYTPVNRPGSPGIADCAPSAPASSGSGGGPIMLSAEQRRALIGGRTPPLTTRQQLLLRPLLVTMTPGTLDPATLCAPGEAANPCSGICDGGAYRGMTCVNGVPTKSGGGAILPLAAGAAALLFLLK